MNNGTKLILAFLGGVIVGVAGLAALGRNRLNIEKVKPWMTGLMGKGLVMNARLGIGLNSLYLLGAIVLGLPPALTAILHNMTTIGIALNAIRPYALENEGRGVRLPALPARSA